MRRHLSPILLIVCSCAGLACLVLGLVWQSGHLWRTPETVTYLGDLIRVPRQSTKSCAALGDVTQGTDALHLFVDGLDSGVTALACDDGHNPAIVFLLRRVPSDGTPKAVEAAAWDRLLSHPLDTIGGVRSVPIDIARADAPGSPLGEGGTLLHLVIFKAWAPVAVVAMLLVWGLTVYLGAESTLVRDPAPAETALERRTFSLARTQFAWWFAIIFASLGFLWLVTGEVPGLSPQALALLGISGATTGLAGAVAPGRLSSAGREGVFFHDLLSDDQGVAIHRFQMVVMTAALGLVFLYEVGTRLTMPTFDTSLLTMMGLSSAAYVGLKIPEAGASAESDPKAGFAAAAVSALPPIKPQ